MNLKCNYCKFGFWYSSVCNMLWMNCCECKQNNPIRSHRDNGHVMESREANE